MITSNLRTNQISETAYDSYLNYLTVLDAKDIDTYAAFLADDVSIQFGNAPAIEAKKPLSDCWGLLAELQKHRARPPKHIWDG